MAGKAQGYGTHRRYHPLFHFFVFPIVLINLILSIVRAVRVPGLESGWQLVMAVGLFGLAFLPRLYALRVQDRLIRLEERLRLRMVLPADIAGKIDSLATRQLIALRFCPDEELAEVTGAVFAGEIKTADEIKRRISKWRPDYLRV